MVQYAAPISEYEPMTVQATHWSFVAAPFVEYLPASQGEHWSLVATVESKYLPGKQEEQLEEPSTLWPLPQSVQASVAPVLKVLTGHFTGPVRSAELLTA